MTLQHGLKRSADAEMSRCIEILGFVNTIHQQIANSMGIN